MLRHPALRFYYPVLWTDNPIVLFGNYEIPAPEADNIVFFLNITKSNKFRRVDLFSHVIENYYMLGKVN